MEFLKVLLKILFIIAMLLLMAVPFAMEYFTFHRDKENKITYKRFRVLVYTGIYFVAITIAMYLLKEFFIWLQAQNFMQWLIIRIAPTSRGIYCGKVLVAVLANFGIGMLFYLLSKLVRAGMKKRDIVNPKKKDGTYSWSQKLERKVIRFFHNETWFFVGSIAKYLGIALSVVYAGVFAIYLIPAVFQADWLPYDYVQSLFSAGYIYPTISLLVIWEIYFFLEGIRRLEAECPELLEQEEVQTKAPRVDLKKVDAEIRKQFADYYVCDVALSDALQEKLNSTEHHPLTHYIAQAVQSDSRNPQKPKEVYLDCTDRLVKDEKSLLINGGFFSEFSMYFLRYLSVIIARGDNVIFVCNSDDEIDTAYDYIVQGLSEISSLYCRGFSNGGVNFDDPIWRAVKVSGEHDVIQEASVDENNILVTSLSYLCSTRFENAHSRFITLTDVIVFVDTLKTVNTFNRQFAILNTRMKHITKRASVAAKNGREGDQYRARYLSRQVRYLCFDDTRTPGLDKVLKNMLAVEIDSVDAMNYNPDTLVRCYRYEGTPDENGRRICPQFFHSKEEMGAIMNMAVLCLAKGAGSVSVFADNVIPYNNIAESLAANMGQVAVKVDGTSIRINKRFYNPDAYSVILAMDSDNNLPAALRRYLSIVSDKPALVIIFSRPYMLRDYYYHGINTLWHSSQAERIPVEEGTRKDMAQRILIRANSGGISRREVLRLAAVVPQFEKDAAEGDVNAILRGVLEIYGETQEDRLNLFEYFEYASTHDFDETGKYVSEDRIFLRRKGRLFERLNGRDMVRMCVGEDELLLPMPRSRLTQNYITGQNLVHNGNIYAIQKIDTAAGRIFARLAVGGDNNEIYQYVQARSYHLEANADEIYRIFPTRHVMPEVKDGDVSVSDVYISVIRAPMEVVTKGYYMVDSHILSHTAPENRYQSISDPGDDELARQTYRRYGQITEPAYSSESILKGNHLISSAQGALMMTLRFTGEFGADRNKTMILAAAMLSEVLRSMFPSVADSIAVCPLIRGEFSDEEYERVLRAQPRIRVTGEHELFTNDDCELVIIEDCASDLGVVSVLMSAGDDILHTLFNPVFDYLNWYQQEEEKSEYLYFGLGHEPTCFDFASVYKLAKLLGDDRHDLRFVDMDTVVEYDVCDFCGKRYNRDGTVIELEDGRKMCTECARGIVGNNRKALKEHLNRARIYLESTYGITLDEDFEVCFESTEKIVNTLKQNPMLTGRGADVSLKSYLDARKKVHVEYDLPSVNLSELLVRELTVCWQRKHLPEIAEDWAEGHIALVAVQYLRFLNQNTLAATRTTYYESTDRISGEGYRKLVRALMENPQFRNNPFAYLLSMTGGGTGEEDKIIPPAPLITDTGDYGQPYTPQNPDRVLDGSVPYFYRPRLTAPQQAAYDTMVEGVRSHQAQVTVSGCSFEELELVADALRFDHPELFWFKTFSMLGDTITLLYGASEAEAAALQARIDEVIPKYLEGITDEMSAYDVAIRLHVRLIASVDYDTIALNKQKAEGGPAPDKIDYLRTICGVFLEGKAVCEGYARAIQYLLQKCGVECAEVAGNIRKENGEDGGGHAWNILKLDGEYYYLDTTWDDSSNTIQSVKKTDTGFSYFGITTEELTRTRAVDLCPIQMPVCTATKANYYYHNGLVLTAFDPEQIKAIAAAAAKGGQKFFTLKCPAKAVFDQTLDQLCSSGKACFDAIKAAGKVDKKINTSSYSYTYDKNIRTITVMFKYK